MAHKHRVRIGLAGAAGVGKTTLATALAERLAIPYFEEEMREYLERTGRPLAGLATAETTQILHDLWQRRATKERTTSSFVADNSCLDFAAYAVFYNCLDGASLDDRPELLRGPIEHLAEYDAIFLLPCGVLPYIRDGVRPSNQYLQLRYHLIIDGLLRRYADRRKVHYLPERCVELSERLRWALSIVERTQRKARKGVVYLVGAGPGDPGLLTVRARDLIAAADVVAHDALVSPAILTLIGPTAEILPVGRRHGAGPTSYRLHPAVLERANAGKTVVRLKAGDPLIFGRGGEEAEELAEAGIPFEIIPGISSALGAAAYAGIPLTHRRYASEVTFVSGHDASASDPTDGSGEGTIVLFMGVRTLAANLARLTKAGRPPNTPAAYIASATTSDQEVIVGTLATLPALTAAIDPTVPALIVIGDVVQLRERIAWFERRPLAGRRLLLGRARPGHSAIAAELRQLGAEVFEAPDVEAVTLDGESKLGAALARIDAFRGIIFACAAAVDAVVEHSALVGVQVIAIGLEAANALARHGVEPAVRARGACREALSEHSALRNDGPFLLVTSEEGRPSLEADLTELGVTIETVAAYRYIYRRPTTRLPSIDLVVLPSSSAARAVLSGDLGDELRQVPMVAMGRRTEQAALRCGAERVVRAREDSSTALISVAVSTIGAL